MFATFFKWINITNGITANRNATLIRLAQARAAQLETVYGRGEFEVRHERPTIPKETQFDKESDIIVLSANQVLKNALQMIRSFLNRSPILQ